MSLKQELAEYRAGWFKRVPAERQAIMERHIVELRNGLAKTALKVGDRAPGIVLGNARGETVDVDTMLKKGPVIVTLYRGGVAARGAGAATGRDLALCIPHRQGDFKPLGKDGIGVDTSDDASVGSCKLDVNGRQPSSLLAGHRARL